MPIYEYSCSQCQNVQEVMQKFSDPQLETCPSCGGPVTKLMSLSSFALKGSGWYTTDYKRSSNSTTSTSGSGGSKTETASKPADTGSSAGASASKASST